MISQKRRSMVICGLLLSLNLLFIWGNSLLPADASGALSSWLLKLLTGVGTEEGQAEPGEGLLRKLAHFCEFASLGFLLGWLLAMLRETSWAWVLPAAVLGCLAACIDELLQYLAPGRAPGLWDVGIDTAGVLAGIGLLCLGKYFKKKNKQHIIGGNEQ